jgi:hypothetical protein
MRKIALIVCISSMVAVAHAQVPNGNVFFGYSYSGGDAFFHSPGFLTASHSTNLNGWEGSLEGKLLPWIGAVVDIAGQYGSHNVRFCALALTPCFVTNVDTNRYTFLLGPRVSVSIGKFRPYAHVLFGAGHAHNKSHGFNDSDTSFATALGGGLDYKLVKGAAWRVQLDDVYTRFFGSTQNHPRFSTGIVVRF